jgi:hypothetical protein
MSDGMLESIRYCLDNPGVNGAHVIAVGVGANAREIFK